MITETFFSKLSIKRLTKKTAPGARLSKEAITEMIRLLEEIGKKLVTEANTYTAASKRTTITAADVKNASAHVLKN